MDKDDRAIALLQMEYTAIRQEIRDQIASIDKNVFSSVAILAGVAALGSVSSHWEIIFVVPTIFITFTAFHFVRQTTINTLAVYCQAIELRLRELVKDDRILLNWEGGDLRNGMARPASPVQIGSYLFFATLLLVYAIIAYYAAKWNLWTIPVHLAELSAGGFLAYLHLKQDRVEERKRLAEKVLLTGNQMNGLPQASVLQPQPGRPGLPAADPALAGTPDQKTLSPQSK